MHLDCGMMHASLTYSQSKRISPVSPALEAFLMDSASAERKKFYGWKVLSVTAVMYFAMTGLLLYSFPVFLPFLCEAFGWSRASVSWANTLAMIVIGFAGPLAGMFIGRYGPRLAIVIGNILCIACFVFLSFHSQLWELYFAFGAFFGLGGSLGGMLAMTTIANNWFVKKRSLALSVLLTAGGLGGFIIVNFLMTLIERIGWRHAYLVIGAIAFFLLVILPALLVRNKPEDMGQVPDGTKELDKDLSKSPPPNIFSTPVDFHTGEALRTPALWLLTIFGTAHMFGLQGFMQHQVAYLMDIGMSSGMAGAAYSTFVGVSVIGRLAIGFLGLKYHMRYLSIIGMVVLIAGMTLVLWTKTLSMVFVYCIIVGIGTGATIVAVMNLFPLYFGRTHYPRIMGYTMPFLTIIGGLGSPLTGWIFDVTGSYALAWRIADIVLVLGLIFLILARPPIHPTLRKDPAAAQKVAYK
jgi:MFS family permease